MKRLLILLLLAFPLMAQHRVSRIQINSSVPSRIVLSQSTLAEGRSYTDDDLKIAVARLKRLPFVYDARYRFEGETLILDVDSMTRFFGDLEASGLGTDDQQTGVATIGGGGRMFLGTGGVAEVIARQHVAEGDDAQSLGAEYSHYGIGGSRFFAIAGLEQIFEHESGFDSDPRLRLTVGYPLTLRSTITANVLTAGFESRRTVPLVAQPLVTSAEQQLINLRYTFDTTDDPYFARQGLVVSGGPEYANEKSRFQTVFFSVPDNELVFIRSVTDSTVTELVADAKKFWPFRERGTFFGEAGAAVSHRELDTVTNDSFPVPGDIDSTDLRLAAGYGHNLASRQRLEFAIGAARHNFSRGDDFFGRSATFDSKSASAAYVLRRPFATVRLNLSYTFD